MTKLKNALFGYSNKYLIKDLSNIIYLYLHTVEQVERKYEYNNRNQIINLLYQAIPKNELNSLNFKYLINDISSFIYRISYLTYIELFIDNIIRERKIFTDFDELRIINKFDLNGDLKETICFDEDQNIEIEMTIKEYKNDIYKKLIVHNNHFDTSTAVFKNDKLDGVVKDIGTYFLYKDGRKLEPNLFQRINAIYKDIQRNQIIFGEK